jgi:hypothetical protein
MRRAASAVLVAAAALVGAGPAWGHEEISPSTIPIGKPVFFILSAANESKADLTKVALAAPRDVSFGDTTKEPPGWTVNRSDTAITWSGGAVKPDRFEQWGFEIDNAPQPGTLTYKVTLGYSDGKTDDVEVPVVAAAVGGPAPGAATSPESTAATGAPSSPPGTGSGSDALAVRAADTTARGRANAALGVGVLAALLALVAAVLAATARRGGRTPRPSGSPGGPGPGSTQDW